MCCSLSVRVGLYRLLFSVLAALSVPLAPRGFGTWRHVCPVFGFNPNAMSDFPPLVREERREFELDGRVMCLARAGARSRDSEVPDDRDRVASRGNRIRSDRRGERTLAIGSFKFSRMKSLKVRFEAN